MRDFIKKLSYKLVPITLGLLIISATIAPFLKERFAQASSPYTASDVLGQTKDNGDPSLTLTAANNNNLRPTDLDSPYDVSLDALHHRLFVADMNNHRVLVFNLDSNNDLIDRSADYVLGQPDFNTNAYGLSQKGMNSPSAVAYDEVNNRLYVADYVNKRILIFDVSTISNHMNASYVLGQTDFDTGDDVGYQQDKVPYPEGLAYDSSNQRLFVADNARVLVFNTSSITNGMNASNVLAKENFTDTAGATDQDTTNNLSQVEYDSTNNRLFINDYTSNRVLVFNTSTITNGMDASYVLGQSNFTNSGAATSQNGMSNPRGGLAYDGSLNRLFVGDMDNDRVLVFNLGSIANGMNASNVLGQANYVTTGANTTQSGMSDPRGMTYNSANKTLFIADSAFNRVQIFDLNSISNGMNADDVIGQIDTNGDPVFTTNDTRNLITPNAIGLYNPTYTLLVDELGLFFVSDTFNDRVMVFDADTLATNKSAVAVLGQTDFLTEGGTTSATGIGLPRGLAYDSIDQLLFVSDQNSHRVLAYDTSDGITTGEAAVHVLGQPDFDTTGSETNAKGFFDPMGLAYDSVHERLFVAERTNTRVLVFNLADGVTDNEDAVNVLGAPDFTTSTTGSVTASTLGLVFGLAYDSVNDRLFVAEGGSRARIMVFDTQTITNGEAAVNVLGPSDFTTASANGGANGVDLVRGLAFDPDQQLLFAADEQDFPRIMIFDVSSITNGEDAIGVLGQTDFSDSSTNYLKWPHGVSFDSENRRLFVGDGQGGHRVMIFYFANITNTSLVTGTAGTSYTDAVDYTGTQGTKTFSVSSGSLPPGVVLGASTGTLSGTPTTSGTYNFTITLTDDNGLVGSYSDSQAYTLTVAAASSSSSSSSSSSKKKTTSSSSTDSTTEETTTDTTLTTTTPTTNTTTFTDKDTPNDTQPSPSHWKWYVGGGFGLLFLLWLLLKLLGKKPTTTGY